MRHTHKALIAASAIALSSGTALADGTYGGSYGGHPMMWGGWFMGPMMMLVVVIIIVVAIVFILKAFDIGGGANSKSDTRDNALAILNERFAKGDIDIDDYEARKKSLTD